MKNKTMDEANKKYRKNKASIQFFTNPNLKREFHLTCIERGLKMRYVLEKFIVDFNRGHESKVLK